METFKTIEKLKLSPKHKGQTKAFKTIETKLKLSPNYRNYIETSKTMRTKLKLYSNLICNFMKSFPNIQWESNFIFTVSGFFCRWWRLFMEWFFSPKDSLKGCQILWVSLIVPIIFWNGFFSILSRSYVCVIISFVWAVAFYISFGGHSEFVGFRKELMWIYYLLSYHQWNISLPSKRKKLKRLAWKCC